MVTHNSQAAAFCHTWPILLFAVAPVLYPLLTVALLMNETSDFINPTLWPPNSPDLNPVDYKIWGCMQEMVTKTKAHDVEDFRKRIRQVWNDFNQRITDSAVREWHKRLRACVEAKGGQFEYKL